MNAIPRRPEALVRANSIELCWDEFGSPDAPPMLLIMGLGAQMILWHDGFCEALANRGFRVIRFDNRDIGRSQRMSGGEGIDFPQLMAAAMQGKKIDAPYDLLDMARDAAGLLDALGIAKAHIVGCSMGGAIAQEMAIHLPNRMLTLTSIMSTPGDPRLPPPTKEATELLMAKPPTTRDDYIAAFERTWRVLRVGSFPQDEATDVDLGARVFSRGLNPAGVGRQLVAIFASGNRTQALGAVKVPTLVIHGNVDPLVRYEAGIATAKAIPGAVLVTIGGMGHALPIPMWPQMVDVIAAHARKAAA